MEEESGLHPLGRAQRGGGGKQALPTHALQLWLKVLTTGKRHNVHGERNQELWSILIFFSFFLFFLRKLEKKIRSLSSISARMWEQGGQRFKKEPTRRGREPENQREIKVIKY